MVHKSFFTELQAIRAQAQMVIDSTERLEKKMRAGVSTPAPTRKGLSQAQIDKLLAQSRRPKKTRVIN